MASPTAPDYYPQTNDEPLGPDGSADSGPPSEADYRRVAIRRLKKKRDFRSQLFGKAVHITSIVVIVQLWALISHDRTPSEDSIGYPWLVGGLAILGVLAMVPFESNADSLGSALAAFFGASIYGVLGGYVLATVDPLELALAGAGVAALVPGLVVLTWRWMDDALDRLRHGSLVFVMTLALIVPAGLLGRVINSALG